MARPGHSAWLILAGVLLLAAAGATGQQGCSPAAPPFPAGRSFQRCSALPVLNASLHWTYHPENGTADVAFRAPPPAGGGWVAWGINTGPGAGMVGSSVFVASRSDATSAVAVLTTVLESLSPSLRNGSLRFGVPVPPAAEFAGGAYTIYATVALPGNATQQNTVWQAGPVRGGAISVHPTSGANLQSTKRLDFLSG